MKLPKVLEFGGALDGVPRRRRTTLVGTIVHDREARRNGSKKSGAVALQPAVMRDDENIDRSELVDGANEFSFFVPREISQIEDTHLAEGDDRTERASVFRPVRGPI